MPTALTCCGWQLVLIHDPSPTWDYLGCGSTESGISSKDPVSILRALGALRLPDKYPDIVWEPNCSIDIGYGLCDLVRKDRGCMHR